MSDESATWLVVACLWLLYGLLWAGEVYGFNPVRVIIWATFICVVVGWFYQRHVRGR